LLMQLRNWVDQTLSAPAYGGMLLVRIFNLNINL
jgi:hypothetical protein